MCYVFPTSSLKFIFKRLC
ncbi:hypothetical protein AB3S75_047203 [Citrus x aurantiifolia]